MISAKASARSSAALGEDLDPAAVLNQIFGLDGVPKPSSMSSQRPGRGNPDGFTRNDGKRRVFRGFRPISCSIFQISYTKRFLREMFAPNTGLVTENRRRHRARRVAWS